MGRLFYLLESSYDYDGRESQVHYLGVNRKAAENRMRWLYEAARRDLFGRRGDEFLQFYPPRYVAVNPDTRDYTLLGSASIYDEGHGAYYDLQLHAIKTNRFFNKIDEETYKTEYPTAKF